MRKILKNKSLQKCFPLVVAGIIAVGGGHILRRAINMKPKINNIINNLESNL